MANNNLQVIIPQLVREIIHNKLAEEQATALNTLSQILCSHCQMENETSQPMRTSVGISLTQELAGNCLNSLVRTRKYWLAIIKAIELLGDEQDIHLLYPGSGPYGALVVPLLSNFSWRNLQVTIIEFRQESANSLIGLIEAMGLDSEKINVVVADAAKYVPDKPVDIIVMECLFAGLYAEGQVSITRHLCQFLKPTGVLIPEQIKLSLFYTDAEKEIQMASKTSFTDTVPDVADCREVICELFTLDKDIGITWPDCDVLLDLGKVMFPAVNSENKAVGLGTIIRLCNDYIIEEYQNGLTYPQYLPVSASKFAGKEVNVKYKMDDNPRLMFYYQGKLIC